jgi:hypothetical protein
LAGFHPLTLLSHSRQPRAGTGDFILCSLNGDEKNVDSTALASFEITESEAKAYLQAEMNQALEEAKNSFSNFMAFSTQTSQAAPSNPSPSSTKPNQPKTYLQTYRCHP